MIQDWISFLQSRSAVAALRVWAFPTGGGGSWLGCTVLNSRFKHQCDGARYSCVGCPPVRIVVASNLRTEVAVSGPRRENGFNSLTQSSRKCGEARKCAELCP